MFAHVTNLKKNPPPIFERSHIFKVKSGVKNKREICNLKFKIDNHDIVIFICAVKMHRIFTEIERKDKELWYIKLETEIC